LLIHLTVTTDAQLAAALDEQVRLLRGVGLMARPASARRDRAMHLLRAAGDVLMAGLAEVGGLVVG